MSTPNLLGPLFEKIAILSSRNPLKVLIVSTLITVGAFFLNGGITVDPSIQNLMPQERPASKQVIQAEEDFAPTEIMLAIVQIPEQVPLSSYRFFIKEYQKKLEKIPELDAPRLAFNSQFVLKIRKFLNRHGLYLMNDESLKELSDRLEPNNVREKMRVKDPYRLYFNQKVFDPLDISALLQKFLPLGQVITLDQSENFFLTKDPKTVFFIVGNDLPWDWPRTKKIIRLAKEKEQEAWDETLPEIQKENPKLTITQPQIQWAGKAMDVLHLTEAIWKSFAGSFWFTTLLVAIVFVFFFRNLKSLFIAYVPVIFGVIWGVAVARLTVGKLNMLSIIVWGALFGMGVDFPTYLLNQYFRLRGEGYPFEEAIKITWRDTGRPVCIGATNVILAFFLLMGSRLPAFRDIGFLTGTGLVLILFLVMVQLPALLRILEGHRVPKPMIDYPSWLTNIPLKFPIATILLCVSLFGGLGLFAYRFKFQSAYEEAYFMFRQGTELMSPADIKLGSLFGASTAPLRFFVEGKNWQELLEKNEALSQLLEKYQKKGEIAHVDSLSFFLPSLSRQEKLIPLLTSLENLDPEGFYLAYKEGVDPIVKDTNIPSFNKGGYRLYGREIKDFLQGREEVDPEEVKSEGLEKFIKHYFVQRDDTRMLATYVFLPQGDYPKLNEKLMGDLTQEKMFQQGEVKYPSAEQAIREIRGILIQDLFWLGGIALFFTLVLIWVAFRSFKMVFVAAVPMILGGFGALGAYTLLRGDFSVFNILWVPIYIGMATDDVLHIGSHLSSFEDSISNAMRHSAAIVILTSVTTIIGFGSSFNTDMEILRRISAWIITALSFELIASLFFFPAMLKIMKKNPLEHSHLAHKLSEK